MQTAVISAVGIEALVDRARGFDFAPELLGLQVATEAEWRAILATASRERAQEIGAGLDELARRRMEERDDAERAHVRAVLQGREQPTPEEQAAANLFRIEAEVQRQEYVAARPERMEAFAARTVELLEKLVAGLERR